MPDATSDMATPTVDTFLTAINNFLRSRDAIQLRGYILVEPPLPEIYATLTSEIRQHFPTGSGDALERKCNASLPEDHNRRPDDELGTSWSSFVTFIKLYFEYLRDVNVENLLETHQLLSALTKWAYPDAYESGRRLMKSDAQSMHHGHDQYWHGSGRPSNMSVALRRTRQTRHGARQAARADSPSRTTQLYDEYGR